MPVQECIVDSYRDRVTLFVFVEDPGFPRPGFGKDIHDGPPTRKRCWKFFNRLPAELASPLVATSCPRSNRLRRTAALRLNDGRSTPGRTLGTAVYIYQPPPKKRATPAEGNIRRPFL